MIPYLDHSTNYVADNTPSIPKNSGILDNIDNIIVTNIERNVDIGDGAIFYIEDIIDIKNYNSNPIYAIIIGVPLDLTNLLINFKGMGESNNNLFAERTGLIISGKYEMITIYLESPIEPLQTKRVTFSHTYIDLANLELMQTETGAIAYKAIYNAHIFPLLPYKAEGTFISNFRFPWATIVLDNDGANNGTAGLITYTRYELEPFTENLGQDAIAKFRYIDFRSFIIEVNNINRDILISPWGTLIIKEDISIINIGVPEVWYFPMFVPKTATNIQTYDDLGEISGTIVNRFDTYSTVNLTLYNNRVVLKKNDVFDFTLKYTLNLRDYLSVNWFQQSIKMSILPTTIPYLIRDQTTRIIIDGCYSIDSISEPPQAIEKSLGKMILTYEDRLVVPNIEHEILITYTIDLFDLLLRPIILIITISLISAIYIIYVKKKQNRRVSSAIRIDLLPQSEIREYCSLNEEKNALVLEMRKAHEDLTRKKMPKKKYRNLVDKNESKIKLIEEEIKPFKKIIIEANATLEATVQSIDIVEAERQTVEDGLKLLDSRYKKGKLSSRAAYEKLSSDFLRRRKKIDRTIDRYIQQLRNYLL
ncbi:MAG: hypothetical protein KGD63_01845 [Candidatus Lokiarchaeota archaeon]|nr:hypothetical protein [Candidatus Lokiarchaeota archaeon]